MANPSSAMRLFYIGGRSARQSPSHCIGCLLLAAASTPLRFRGFSVRSMAAFSQQLRNRCGTASSSRWNHQPALQDAAFSNSEIFEAGASRAKIIFGGITKRTANVLFWTPTCLAQPGPSAVSLRVSTKMF
jgi:hypothetical protein